MSTTTRVRTLSVGKRIILKTGAAIEDEAGKALVNASGPQIRGTWFFVDPLAGSNANDGLTISTAVADLQTAYGLCTTNVGDGIVVLSSDADTAANTSSYLTHPLLWAKNSIAVVGVCAPVRTFQRARVSNKVITTGALTSILTFTRGTGTTYDYITRSSGSFITNGFAVGDHLNIVTTDAANDAVKGCSVAAVSATVLTLDTIGTLVTEAAGTGKTQTVTTYNETLLTVSGSNNSFYNLHLTHGGANALELTSLKVTGNRNYFENVHAAIGLGSAATNLSVHSLWLYAAAENVFKSCTFGTDTVDRGNNASSDILISGACARNQFLDCGTLRMTTIGTAGHAVQMTATTGGRPTLFDNCRFTCWSTASGNANQATCFYSADATQCDDVWLTGNTCMPGYAATGLGGTVWIQGANVAAGVAGILTTTA